MAALTAVDVFRLRRTLWLLVPAALKLLRDEAEARLAAIEGGTVSLAQLVFGAPTELTISAGGAVTPTRISHKIDTAADGATDDLDTLTGVADGELIFLRPENAARDVVIRDTGGGTGNIRTPYGKSITLAELTDWALGIGDGTNVTIIAFRTAAGNGGGSGALIGLLASLTTTAKTTVVAAINELVTSIAAAVLDIGTLAALTSTDKTSIVAALNEARALVDAGLTLQKRTLTSTHADLVAAAATETVNIGAVLPANARIIGIAVRLTTPFSGGTVGDFTVDIGTAGDVDALVDGADLFAAAVDGMASTMPLGIAPHKNLSAAQLIATFRCGSDDVADATAGSVTIDVLFAQLA